MIHNLKQFNMQKEKIVAQFMSTTKEQVFHGVCKTLKVVIAENEMSFLEKKGVSIPRDVILLKIKGEGFFDPDNISIDSIINIVNIECRRRWLERSILLKKELKVRTSIIHAKFKKESLKPFSFSVVSKKGLIKKALFFPFFSKEEREVLQEMQKLLKNLRSFFVFTIGQDSMSEEIRLISLGETYTFPNHKNNKIMNGSTYNNYLIVRVG